MLRRRGWIQLPVVAPVTVEAADKDKNKDKDKDKDKEEDKGDDDNNDNDKGDSDSGSDDSDKEETVTVVVNFSGWSIFISKTSSTPTVYSLLSAFSALTAGK